jgi:outer membrane murein-binding lipoprotein Lpp
MELRKEGVAGGANTADQAADEIDRLAIEVSRLHMEMAAYREKLTPADAAAMVAVINSLYEEKKRITHSGDAKL